MIVLPDGEEILDVICGDRDFWVISAVQNVAHVKPAKAGAETNLNLVTARGTIYSFLLNEKSGRQPAGSQGLRERRPDGARRPTEVLQRRRSRAPAGRADRGQGGDDPRRAAGTRDGRLERQQFPTRLQFPYGAVKYEKPFLVRAIWHDGQFTYLKSDATELPALYELKDGKPAVVNFQVQNGGTYVVPKVLERGYLALGNAQSGVRAAGAVVMAEHVDAPGTAPVIDRRPVPRGVLPRGVQTWLMAALAVGMLLIIFLTGKPEAPPAARQSAVAAAGAERGPGA